jgi:hypothetical protein
MPAIVLFALLAALVALDVSSGGGASGDGDSDKAGEP